MGNIKTGTPSPQTTFVDLVHGLQPCTTIMDHKERSPGYERGAGTLWAGFHLQVFSVPCNSYLTVELMKHDNDRH